MIYRTFSWLLILFACFYGMGQYPLLDSNDGMYAAIARDMLKGGNFIIPHLNGMPYLEKPPMLYWLMALSMSLFGINEWSAHLIPACALFMTVYYVYRFTHHATRSEPTGFAAALMLVTSLPIMIMGRSILCDMIMTCFLTAALLQFYHWYSGHSRYGLTRFYAFLALAVLTKGFLAFFIAYGTIGVFLLWQRSSPSYYFKLFSLKGILLFLLIIAPWHIASAFEEPGFTWFYFINEHLYRFLNMREPHDYHTGHIWYYIPRLLGYLLPWTLFLALFIKKPLPLVSGYPQVAGFLWSWFLFCFVFFSFAGGKANYYLIVGTPALVMLVALRLKLFSDHNSPVVSSLSAGGLLLVATVLIATQCFCTRQGMREASCQVTTGWLMYLAILFSMLAVALCYRIPQRWLPQLLGINILFLLPLLISAVNYADGKLSQKNVAEYFRESGFDHVAIYQEFEELSSLAFYLDNPLIIIDSHSSDLLYGQKKPEGKPYFMTLHEWAEHSPRLPMVVLKQQIGPVMETLIAEHLDINNVCVIHRFERVAVIHVCHKETL